MTIVLAIIIALFGALVRTVFGFGESLVTMPLLMLIGLNLQLSTALVGALGLLVALPASFRIREHIDYPTVIRLVIGSLFGVVCGVLLIKYVDPKIIRVILGIFLLLYGSYSLLNSLFRREKSAHLKSNYFDYLAGLLSGTLGSAFNSHGVIVVIYGTIKKWPLLKLRAVTQAHFVCVGILVVISQFSAGFWSWDVVKLLLIILPLLLLVIRFGNWITTVVHPNTLVKYVYGLLIIFGILMLIQ